MVRVDFGNKFYREYLPQFIETHRGRLLGLTEGLGKRAAEYTAAEAALAAQLGRAPRALAATLDIDEVLICNVHMNSDPATNFYADDFFTRPDGSRWPRGSTANPLLPGAREFLLGLRSLGVEILLVIGRIESSRAETVENLVAVGRATYMLLPPKP